VQDDGRTQLLDAKPAEDSVIEDLEVETEPVKKEDPLNLNQPDKESKEETKQESGKKLDKSFLLDPESEPESTKEDRHVPVREIQKERAKRQAAEQEAASLREQLEKSQKSYQDAAIDDDISKLVEDPDDLIDAKTASRIAQATARKAVQEYIQSQETASTKQKSREQMEATIDANLDQARKKYADFDRVTTEAIENGYISEDERRSFAASKNPAALLYAKSKERLNILGSNQTSVSGNKQESKELLSPDTGPTNDLGIYDVLRG